MPLSNHRQERSSWLKPFMTTQELVVHVDSEKCDIKTTFINC